MIISQNAHLDILEPMKDMMCDSLINTILLLIMLQALRETFYLHVLHLTFLNPGI